MVVDNGADRQAAEIAAHHGEEYVDSGGNVGPAGGIVPGMRWVLEQAADEDWILLDDDEPPTNDDALDTVRQFKRELVAAAPE